MCLFEYKFWHSMLKKLFTEVISYVLYHASIQCQAAIFLDTILLSSHMYPENPKGTQVIISFNEHGKYIRHCRESNSQPVPSQVGADPTRPQ